MSTKRNGALGRGAVPENQAGGRSTANGTRLADVARLAERQSYVIRVAVTLANGQCRVQHYASLHAAVKAEERARARGCEAVLALARVVPVGIITADELDVLRGDL